MNIFPKLNKEGATFFFSDDIPMHKEISITQILIVSLNYIKSDAQMLLTLSLPAFNLTQNVIKSSLLPLSPFLLKHNYILLLRLLWLYGCYLYLKKSN